MNSWQYSLDRYLTEEPEDEYMDECPICDGEGTDDGETKCHCCDGKGYVYAKEE